MIGEVKIMFPKLTKVLVCDDSLVSRRLVVKSLSEEEFAFIDEADCAESAIQLLFESDTSNYELLLLDISMPGMLGTELVSKIRKSSTRYKDLPIIMISAETEKATVLKALVNGANDYILKPLDKDVLLKKMKNVWGKLSEDTQSNILLRTSRRKTN